MPGMRHVTLSVVALLLHCGPAAGAEQPKAPFPYVWGKAYHILPRTHNNESGYFSLSQSLDGRIHVGTAKYNENAYLVEFDPRTERQRIVVDVNKVCGVNATGYAAQAKIHTRNFVAPSGRIYVGSKQGYPEAGDTSKYPGGYVVVYDPATGEAKSLGMPMAEQGVADVVADESRGVGYVVTCEEQHWMRLDLNTGQYRELGPLLTPYAMTLIDPRGVAHAITHDFQLASYDPAADKVTVRPIELEGVRWTRKDASSIPTWKLAADGRTAYLVLMNDATLLSIDVSGDGDTARATNHGLLIDGKGFDSRCGLDIGPDGRVYVVGRVDNTTGFGTGYLHHLLRYDPATKQREDLGVLAVANPDFFSFGPGADGKTPPWSHGYHTLPDGTMTPLHHHMSLLVAADSTIYVTIIAPFTLLKIDAYRTPQVDSPARSYLDALRKGLDHIEHQIEATTKVAEVIAERHIAGGLIGVPWHEQSLSYELWGRSGSIMHLGFERPWSENRTEEQKRQDVAIIGFERAPRPQDMEQITQLKQRGVYLVGIGSKALPELAEYVKACDAWLDNGRPADDRAVTLPNGDKAGRTAHMLNIVQGWVLIGETVGALTRRGKMPAMWKSWYWHDGRQWSDGLFGKKQFHDEYEVPPHSPGTIGGQYVASVRYLLERFEATQLDGVRKAGEVIAAEHRAGRKTIVASTGHIAMVVIGKYEDAEWAKNHEIHEMVEAQMQSWAETPREALVLRMEECKLHRDVAKLFRDKSQRVIVVDSACPYPERQASNEFDLRIDAGYPFGDALVPVKGYPIRILPASGAMMLAAYESINVEALSRIAQSQ